MNEQGIVELSDSSTGRGALRAEDGSYVLVEQLDAQDLQRGQVLVGPMNSMGMESLVDQRTGAIYKVFVLAFGLSLEGVRLAV